MFWFFAGVASAFALLWRTSAPKASPKSDEEPEESREEAMADVSPAQDAEDLSGPGEDGDEPAPARQPLNPFKRAVEDRRPPVGFSGSFDDLADADVPDPEDLDGLEDIDPEEENEGEGS